MLLYCPFASSRHIAPSILWFFLKWLFRVYFCIENINNSFFVFFKNIFCCPPKWMPTIFWPTKTVFSKMLSSHISRHFSIYKKHFSKTFFHVLILTKNFFHPKFEYFANHTKFRPADWSPISKVPVLSFTIGTSKVFLFSVKMNRRYRLPKRRRDSEEEDTNDRYLSKTCQLKFSWIQLFRSKLFLFSVD